jgi:hypothetical protein
MLKHFERANRSRNRRAVFECLETRRLLAVLPYGAHWQDTGEFMLGTAVVTPVFLESNGGFDADIETWNSQDIDEVLGKIEEAMDWWVESLAQLNTVHNLSFVIDTTFAIDPFETIYEPINRPSNDYVLYVNEFLQSQGATTGNIEREIRSFNHSQREKFDTDWSFTIFVANSEFQNSQDQMGGQFAPGGSFRRAFAFAGGLFMVVPSSRPASTFAHETGHIFWARDEYPGGGSYFSQRGYYNTRNENAWDNPTPGFVQEPSIMAAGVLLNTAYQNFTSAAATFAQLGWQDSDGNGIFDVLDVPTKLVGAGYWDAETGLYHFSGYAEVQTLPNLNSSGLRNDITLNRIREIEFRFDNGPWQVHSLPDDYRVELDLEIAVPPGAGQIEIRARDSSTTVSSNVFRGRLERADATAVPGINGFLWLDDNRNGLRDVGEFGPTGWQVSLLDSAGQPISTRRTVEPDSLSIGPIGSAPIEGVLFGTIGNDTDGRVGILEDSSASTGSRVFSAYSIPSQNFVNTWTTAGRRMKASFVSPTTTVSIDAIGVAANSYGRLEAYNSQGQLLERYTTGPLAAGQVERMTVSRGIDDIAYVIASATAQTRVRLDHLQYGPESSVVTDELGQYRFPFLAPGQYTVSVTTPSEWMALSPSDGQSLVTVSANTPSVDVDFGFTIMTSDWQNPVDPHDVNDDGRISALDALQVINALNLQGPGTLAGSGLSTPPYVDVNGDGRLSALDALMVINELNQQASGGGGEGEAGGGPFRLSGTAVGAPANIPPANTSPVDLPPAAADLRPQAPASLASAGTVFFVSLPSDELPGSAVIEESRQGIVGAGKLATEEDASPAAQLQSPGISGAGWAKYQSASRYFASISDSFPLRSESSQKGGDDLPSDDSDTTDPSLLDLLAMDRGQWSP